MDNTAAPANTTRTGTPVAGQAAPGDLVSYSDIANPRATFVVLAINDDRFGRDYTLLGNDLVGTTSDLRARSWRFEH